MPPPMPLPPPLPDVPPPGGVGIGRGAEYEVDEEGGAGGAGGASGRETGVRPMSVRIAGRTNTVKEMYAETELPGSVTIGVLFGPISPKPCGLPGCIATGPNHTPSRRSDSFTTS